MKTIRILHGLLILVLFVSLAPASVPVRAAVEPVVINPFLPHVPGEVLVVLKGSVTPEKARGEASALAGSVSAQVVEVGPHGVALLRAAEDADLAAMITSLSANASVQAAEPNYIYSIPTIVPSETLPDTTKVYLQQKDSGEFSIREVSDLRAMTTRKGFHIQATYPSDVSLFDNWGYSNISGLIVWPNTTPSRGVCVVDTGVDYTHPDLSGRIVKGYDFINNDADPMDDNGHGTHVAGIIAAKTNNKIGIAGLSTGKVIAVKSLDAYGKGTAFEIEKGIEFCSARADVNIINLSLGGAGYSIALETAVSAAQARNKLLVVAAGNDNVYTYCTWDHDSNPATAKIPGGDLRSYPAGFTASGPKSVNPSNCTNSASVHPAYNNVISVGAYDYSNLRWSSSNYGSWIDAAAPGDSIYSTTPWDKPFEMNYDFSVAARYAFLSGTSMAAPFVAATAARAWGFLAANPSLGYANPTHSTVISWLSNKTGAWGGGGLNGWPSQQATFFEPNIAWALHRGGIEARAWDALTGLPLKGATISAYEVLSPTSAPLRGSGVISSNASSYVDILNLPAGPTSTYKLLINAPGYTTGPQAAFISPYALDGTVNIQAGYVGGAGETTAAVPPKSGKFTITAMWANFSNLDLIGYVPLTWLNQYKLGAANPPGDDYGWDEGIPWGSTSRFPYARFHHPDKNNWEAIVIEASPKARTLPYIPGTYTFRLTNSRTSNWIGDSNSAMFAWQGGKIVTRVNNTCSPTNQTLWWNGLTITSGASGKAAVTALDTCAANPPPAGY